MSNFIVLCLCLRFPPGWFVLNLMVSTPCSDDFFWTDSWQAIEKLWYLFHVLVQVEYPHRYLYLQIDYLIAQSRETARLPGRTIIPLQHLGNCGHLSFNYVKTSSLTHIPKQNIKSSLRASSLPPPPPPPSFRQSSLESLLAGYIKSCTGTQYLRLFFSLTRSDKTQVNAITNFVGVTHWLCQFLTSLQLDLLDFVMNDTQELFTIYSVP